MLNLHFSNFNLAVLPFKDSTSFPIPKFRVFPSEHVMQPVLSFVVKGTTDCNSVKQRSTFIGVLFSSDYQVNCTTIAEFF